MRRTNFSGASGAVSFEANNGNRQGSSVSINIFNFLWSDETDEGSLARTLVTTIQGEQRRDASAVRWIGGATEPPEDWLIVEDEGNGSAAVILAIPVLAIGAILAAMRVYKICFKHDEINQVRWVYRACVCVCVWGFVPPVPKAVPYALRPLR